MTRQSPADPPPLTALLGRGRATVGELFLARAELSPDHPCLRFGGRSWTYSEARVEAERFAGWLGAREGGAPARVASYLPNRPEAMWAWLGTLLAGSVYVPLNRAHRGPLLADMLARSGAAVVVTDAEGLPLLPEPGPDGPAVLVAGGGAVAPALSWQEVEAGAPRARPVTDPAALAEVMFTSGTTGRSKAVLIPHNYLARGGGWVAWSLGLGPRDTVHAWLPLFHIGGQLDTVLAFFVAGGTIALQPTFSRSRFWEQVDECGATVFVGFSNVLEILWGMEPRPGEAAGGLRAGIVGGIPPKLHHDFEARFGLRLHDIYGMTEAEPLAFPRPGEPAPVGTAGPASPDFEVAILGAEGERLGAGELGQIAFRPRVPDVMLGGYEGDPEAFLAASPGLWFCTGDLGRVDADGNVAFVDRAKHAIRRRGENISSFELERLILAHEQVEECSVVGVPSPLGEEDVKAVVAPRDGVSIEPAALRSWCAEQMAAFMVPRYIDVREKLPRGPTGKVQKEELAAISASVFDAEAGDRRQTTQTGRES